VCHFSRNTTPPASRRLRPPRASRGHEQGFQLGHP